MKEIVMYESVKGQKYTCTLKAAQADFRALRDDVAELLGSIPIPRGSITTVGIAEARVSEVKEGIVRIENCLNILHGIFEDHKDLGGLPEWAKERIMEDE